MLVWRLGIISSRTTRSVCDVRCLHGKPGIRHAHVHCGFGVTRDWLHRLHGDRKTWGARAGWGTAAPHSALRLLEAIIAPVASSLSGLTRNMFVNISQFHSSPSKPVEAVPTGNHSDYVRRKFLEPYAPAWHSRTLRIPYSSATCGREAEVRNDARQC